MSALRGFRQSEIMGSNHDAAKLYGAGWPRHMLFKCEFRYSEQQAKLDVFSALTN